MFLMSTSAIMVIPLFRLTLLQVLVLPSFPPSPPHHTLFRPRIVFARAWILAKSTPVHSWKLSSNFFFSLSGFIRFFTDFGIEVYVSSSLDLFQYYHGSCWMNIATKISDFQVFIQVNCVLTKSLLLAPFHVLLLCAQTSQVSLEVEHHLPVFPVVVPVELGNVIRTSVKN